MLFFMKKRLTMLSKCGKLFIRTRRGVIFLYGVLIMATKTARAKITFECTECKRRNYDSMKNKKNDPDRLVMSKYCPFCKKHTEHKESK
jgi:large subunit ribosomal protein L33